MSDPRLGVIGCRLEEVGKVVAISSGKGGVGKSMFAVALAMNMKDRGYRVGLLDLDFTSPSTHVILGAGDLQPIEEYGIKPPMVHGLHYMSITYYSKDKPTPLRGGDVSNAIVELLAIIRWGKLDYLIIDMPPGIGDATLDLIRLIEGVSFLIISTPSKVAFETVKKLLELLRSLKISVIGVVENMVMTPSNYIRSELESLKVPYLGAIEFDPGLEEAIGYVERLLSLKFTSSVAEIASRLD